MYQFHEVERQRDREKDRDRDRDREKQQRIRSEELREAGCAAMYNAMYNVSSCACILYRKAVTSAYLLARSM